MHSFEVEGLNGREHIQETEESARSGQRKKETIYLQSIALDPSGLTWKARELSRGVKAICTGKLNHLSASPIGAIVALDHGN